PADAPRHRLTLLAEESLRLCSLPGEDEGRVYYFRRLRISNLPANGDRRVWLEAIQSAVRAQASTALHGGDPGAASVDAVYFRSLQEACETLLLSIAIGTPATAWYWPSVSGVPRDSHSSESLVAVMEKLRASPAGWVAVAAAVREIARRADLS